MAKLTGAAIQDAMADAVVLANAKGITDPEQIRALMADARERVKQQHEEEEIIAQAKLENARNAADAAERATRPQSPSSSPVKRSSRKA